MLPPDLATAAPHLPPAVAERAATAYTCAVERGTAADHLLVADMSQPSSTPRLFVFDLSDPSRPVLVERTRVAHGAGSDPRKTGKPERFGNTPESGETSLGLYQVAEPYIGVHGKSYRLDGLTPGFNDAARSRAVVLHPAPYVRDRGPVGRSLGCPAIAPRDFTALDHRGALEGALVWIDGPDASLDRAPSLRCAATAEPVRACSKADFAWPLSDSTSAAWGIAWAG
jgi:hypothetical protein